MINRYCFRKPLVTEDLLPEGQASADFSVSGYVYLISCRSNAIYTGIALDVAARKLLLD